MATVILVGTGIAVAAAAGRYFLRASPRVALGGGSRVASWAGPDKNWVKGGFETRMTKSEAAQILGIRETQIDPKKIRERHRRMMLNNHPDRGGSPFLAAKVNEASDLLIKGDQRRR